jgi:hypothetical protein
MTDPSNKIARNILAVYEEYEAFVRYQQLEGKYMFYCPADTPSIASSVGGIVMVLVSFFLVILVAFGTLLEGIFPFLDNQLFPPL